MSEELCSYDLIVTRNDSTKESRNRTNTQRFHGSCG